MAFPTRVYGKFGDEKKTPSTKSFKFGTVLELPDGRLFRYCQANGALSSGRLVTGRALSHADHDGDLVLPTSASLGDTTITVTNSGAAVVVNQFNDGLLFVNDDGSGPAGEGMFYRIKTSSVAGTTAAITIVLDEQDGIQGEALTAGTTQLGLIENEYSEVNLWDADAIDGVPVGWTQAPVADNDYFWACTHGPTMALYDSDDNSVRGRSVIPSTSVDGAIRGYDLASGATIDNQTIGFAMVISVDTELMPVFAAID